MTSYPLEKRKGFKYHIYDILNKTCRATRSKASSSSISHNYLNIMYHST